MSVKIKKTVAVEECDGCCNGPATAIGYGMGNAVPPGNGTIGSGDAWGAFTNMQTQAGMHKRVKVRKRNRKSSKK